MPTALLQSAITLIGDTPQIRVRRIATSTDYDITVPAGTYFVSQSGGQIGNLVQTINTRIASAVGSGAPSLSCSDNLTVAWSGGSAYTLRLLSCDDTPYLARALGLYGASRDLTYYTTHDAPATFARSLHTISVVCGYDHVARDQFGIPEWRSDLRVAESGYAACTCRGRRDLLDVTLQAVEGQYLSAQQGATVTLWDVLDVRYADPLLYLRVSVGASVRIDGAYSMAEPVAPESVRRRVDLWSGYYDLSLRLVRLS